MKENPYLMFIIYGVAMYAIANYMCEKIFRLGITMGEINAGGRNLYVARKLSHDKNVITYPFNKELPSNDDNDKPRV